MAGAASACACLLAAVFAWAAATKAVAPRATARAFSELRVPWPAVTALAVPVAEVSVAAVLVLAPAVGAALALALLAAFTMVVIRALVAGNSAPCGCFGSRRVEPVGPADVVRNGLLAALAAVATGTARLVRPGWLAVGEVVLAVAAAGVAWRVALRRLST